MKTTHHVEKSLKDESGQTLSHEDEQVVVARINDHQVKTLTLTHALTLTLIM